jgi:hypothetical protein
MQADELLGACDALLQHPDPRTRRHPSTTLTPVRRAVSFTPGLLGLGGGGGAGGGGGGGGLTVVVLGGAGFGWNTARVETGAVTVRLQVVPCPAHAPVHCSNVAPESGLTFSVSFESVSKRAMQVEPQSIPAGELLTLPGPEVLTETVWTLWKLAPTSGIPVMVSAQVGLVPLHAPVQPPNLEPASGFAVSVTLSP